MNENELLQVIKEYFKIEIFENHKNLVLTKHSKLKSYKINPILVNYLSKVLEDDFTPIGVAKALYYPRVMGTSINTSFGTKIQKMFVKLGLAVGSDSAGMDIDFTDKIDGELKQCQLKAGPNTINHDDVSPILKKFDKVIHQGRTNFKRVNNNDLVLGVLYGSEDQLSQHYKRIDQKYPVIIGKDFWHRITGFPEFYPKLVIELDSVIRSFDTESFFEIGFDLLIKEVESSDLFNFS